MHGSTAIKPLLFLSLLHATDHCSDPVSSLIRQTSVARKLLFQLLLFWMLLRPTAQVSVMINHATCPASACADTRGWFPCLGSPSGRCYFNLGCRRCFCFYRFNALISVSSDLPTSVPASQIPTGSGRRCFNSRCNAVNALLVLPLSLQALLLLSPLLQLDYKSPHSQAYSAPTAPATSASAPGVSVHSAHAHAASASIASGSSALVHATWVLRAALVSRTDPLLCFGPCCNRPYRSRPWSRRAALAPLLRLFLLWLLQLWIQLIQFEICCSVP